MKTTVADVVIAIGLSVEFLRRQARFAIVVGVAITPKEDALNKKEGSKAWQEQA